MKSTLIELPPELLETTDDPFVDLEFLDEFEVGPQVRNRLFKPGTSFGAYQVIGFIAAGGMGEVYAAERLMSDGSRLGPVALKVMAPEYRDDWMVSQRFKREAKISRSIKSIHVPRVFEFGETDDGHLFLVMELLKGEELFDRLCQRYSLTEFEVAGMTAEILEGLGAIHEQGFVHRDLKPENIYFHQLGGGQEVIKILDFGIAKIASEESDPYLSVVGRIYGTPEYIAPEQGFNPQVDLRADLYSIGIIMYECLAGSLPFEGDTPYVTIMAHDSAPVPRLPSSVDPELAEIVYKALAKDPDDRFQSAAEMIELLQFWIAEHEDDGLGVSLRDSADIKAPHTRPMFSGQKRLRTKRQIVDTRGHDSDADSDPEPQRETGPELRGPKTDELPPVQIFSRPANMRTPTGEMDAPSIPATKPEPIREPAAPAAEPRPAKAPLETPQPTTPAAPKSDNEPQSMLPTIVTGIAILVIIAAVVWSFL